MQQKERATNQYSWTSQKAVGRISDLCCISLCFKNWKKKIVLQIHFYCNFICFTTKARAETINLSIQPWFLRGCVNGTIKKALKANIWQPVKISPFLKLNGLASPRMGDEGTIERLLYYSCNDKPDGFKSQRLHIWISHYSKQITLGPAKWNLSCPRHSDMFHCTINLRGKYLTAHSTFCIKKSHGGTVLKWHL